MNGPSIGDFLAIAAVGYIGIGMLGVIGVAICSVFCDLTMFMSENNPAMFTLGWPFYLIAVSRHTIVPTAWAKTGAPVWRWIRPPFDGWAMIFRRPKPGCTKADIANIAAYAYVAPPNVEDKPDPAVKLQHLIERLKGGERGDDIRNGMYLALKENGYPSIAEYHFGPEIPCAYEYLDIKFCCSGVMDTESLEASEKSCSISMKNPRDMEDRRKSYRQKRAKWLATNPPAHMIRDDQPV